MSISIHGPTGNGGYNVIGTENGRFILQGNLTKAQLKELAKEIRETLKK
jgi:hypothetical protein